MKVRIGCANVLEPEIVVHLKQNAFGSVHLMSGDAHLCEITGRGTLRRLDGVPGRKGGEHIRVDDQGRIVVED